MKINYKIPEILSRIISKNVFWLDSPEHAALKETLKNYTKLLKYMYSENNKSFNIYVSAGTPKPPHTKLTVFSTSHCLPRTLKQTGFLFFAFIN